MHSLLPKPATPAEFSAQVIGTFSFLFALGLIAQVIKVRRETGSWPVKERLAPFGGFLYPALMFAWAAAPDRFGPAFAWMDNWACRMGGLGLICLGASVMAVAMHAMGPAWRMGEDPAQTETVVADGIYAKVRHPIYSGFLAVLAGVWLVSGGLFFALLGTGYAAVLVWKARNEERHMSAVFGDRYREYMARTGMFIP